MPTELQLKALRALPAVDEVLTTLSRSIPMEVFPHELVVDCIRKEVEAARAAVACFKKYANLVCKHYPSILNEKTPCDAEGLC